jgi:hypothetical protein
MSAQPTAGGAAGRIPRLFGLEGDRWMRHTNPVSVWSRFSVLAVLALAIWSRDWIGWLCLVPIALALVWMMVNPLVFAPPRSTRNWASKGVLGERIWTERASVELPPQFTATVPTIANVFALAGIVVIAYGLYELQVLPVVTGLITAYCGKLWFIDRMVLLFGDAKIRNPRYAAWEY